MMILKPKNSDNLITIIDAGGAISSIPICWIQFNQWFGLLICIFIGYCKEDTCYTLVDLYCTFDLYIVYCGSSKKVLTALLTLADCVGSQNRIIALNGDASKLDLISSSNHHP